MLEVISLLKPKGNFETLEDAAMKILVVEDEPNVAEALRQGLSTENYSVTVAPTGEDGFFHANSEDFDLVLLDIMLPGRSGLEILSALRKKGVKTPVLILT